MMPSHDVQLLARVWAHPRVRPHITLGCHAFLNEETAERVLGLPGVIFLANEHGGFLLVPCSSVPTPDATVYDLHTQFVPSGWGPALLEFARECTRYMFVSTDCVAIRTFVPHYNRVAKRLAERVGFVKFEDSEVFGAQGITLAYTLKKWVRDVCQQ